ncbi:uncharacterized protein Dyak_GE27303 [Drosophila yakuba]|uniref:Uncharacterized protein n=1 Tax=Drosophila yakuba TaxID=7245 RepID=A0A0R1DZV9_DROYA|nr:uncharacterized protein Dyak_GE27303 [Drosophila yakuba]
MLKKPLLRQGQLPYDPNNNRSSSHEDELTLGCLLGKLKDSALEELIQWYQYIKVGVII